MKAETKTKPWVHKSETRPACWLRCGPGIRSRGGGKQEAAGAPARHSRGLAEPWGRDMCSLPGATSKVPPGLGAALGASLERSPCSRHLLLGLLLPVCFSPCYVPRFDFQRKFPQGLLRQVVAEVIEEVYDVIVSSDIVVPVGGASGQGWCGAGSLTASWRGRMHVPHGGGLAAEACPREPPLLGLTPSSLPECGVWRTRWPPSLGADPVPETPVFLRPLPALLVGWAPRAPVLTLAENTACCPEC